MTMSLTALETRHSASADEYGFVVLTATNDGIAVYLRMLKHSSVGRDVIIIMVEEWARLLRRAPERSELSSDSLSNSVPLKFLNRLDESHPALSFSIC